jgi:hypothetical protein
MLRLCACATDAVVVTFTGRYWDFFRWCFVNRKVVKGDQQGVVVFRPINAGMLKEPRAEERFEVCQLKMYNALAALGASASTAVHQLCSIVQSAYLLHNLHRCTVDWRHMCL